MNFVYCNIFSYIASEVTVCEQILCKFLNENIHSGTNSAAELESLSCLSCLEKTEKDNTIAMFIETFLELMKHVFVTSNKNGWYFRIFYK